MENAPKSCWNCGRKVNSAQAGEGKLTVPKQERKKCANEAQKVWYGFLIVVVVWWRGMSAPHPNHFNGGEGVKRWASLMGRGGGGGHHTSI